MSDRNRQPCFFSRPARIAALLAACLALGGCERMFRDMYDQPKLKTATSTPLFSDGLASRPPPPGSLPLALGEAAANSSGRRGQARIAALDTADLRQALPAPIDAALLARGHERYDIYCAPCHSVVGDGDGAVVRRGFPAPPSYHIERLRAAPDRHFFDVITSGYGVMYSYADRIDGADRWAIVAWIRRLQGEASTSLAAAKTTPAPSSAGSETRR
jgi:mono/diheme cytochrome c family protein